jgi:hypothetical protein
MLGSMTTKFSRAAAGRPGSIRHFRATCERLAKLNVEGLAEKVDLKGQNVLMRVDLNVPLSKEVRDFHDDWHGGKLFYTVYVV